MISLISVSSEAGLSFYLEVQRVFFFFLLLQIPVILLKYVWHWSFWAAFQATSLEYGSRDLFCILPWRLPQRALLSVCWIFFANFHNFKVSFKSSESWFLFSFGL